jgi:hypothetical protein
MSELLASWEEECIDFFGVQRKRASLPGLAQPWDAWTLT